MNVSYELLPDDFAAFIEFHQQSSPVARRQRLGCFAIGLAALLVLPVGILLMTDKPRLEAAINIWPLLLGPILFAVFIVPYVRWRTRQMSRRLLTEGTNAGFYGACDLAIDSEGLTESRPSGSTSRKWTSVERIVTTPQHLFVYTSGIEAFVVPRRAFGTDSEFNAFADAIADKCGVAVERT
ncbi:MAG: YcxB family protein [Planctomycetaceae bacterium]